MKEAVKSRANPTLSLTSVKLQEGERKDVDVAVSELPLGVQYGFLGDRFLGADFAGFEECRSHLEETHAIVICRKYFLRTEAEYFDVVAELK